MAINVSLTEKEALAICQFFSYGATRGNHPDGCGPGSGPLSHCIDEMGNAVNKIRDAMRDVQQRLGPRPD